MVSKQPEIKWAFRLTPWRCWGLILPKARGSVVIKSVDAFVPFRGINRRGSGSSGRPGWFPPSSQRVLSATNKVRRPL
ncbi:hypothetical protein SERLADRAFT_456534 [Serpula lacrymans var. lacrymans S7.9]|uniref:Uncharacterized protein n=1 Tax=Serpula lacrymans var. lacrymans (strain S7.9) TaxID=578457 RepID=F8NHI4_SERL9|nr:uncharacterized protein SERLADRAFT_456534 [Serpula lacrymans var. lacrymans S7.9]EGO29155.1 hypothetical protein SERLADRAFT_456534 [Serpula lacrymans var. lacrymans S7.9]